MGSIMSISCQYHDESVGIDWNRLEQPKLHGLAVEIRVDFS